MPLIYGHRGARAEAPENTLPSFRKALEAGVTRVELDLHLSADQQLIVIHDPTLRRTTGLGGKVAQHPATHLTRLDARHALPDWPEPCLIPSLEQLFESCPEFEHYQLEVKSGSQSQSRLVIDAILRLVERFELHNKVTITSSSRILLRYAHDSGCPLPTGLVEEYGLLDPVKSALRYGCQMLVLNWTLCSPALLARAQASGLHVSVWTVNDLDLMQRLAQMGVDSIITDVPSQAVRLLGNSG
ncbi:glycerophosphodiester phosphodiesterase [Halopseudomonas phragmitis]|uniref:Glycerophosphodiester phosphodiesterase n=2 Tax=Pseudomonadaceae TaxID=135621 RepID=A0A1V0B6P6_9GAMM|nr:MULTISPECIES: glycerophosphodiester phosphodiesterase [Pseudomonadaceae]AQZ95612.1 glycerophosphodiester phosphodiesterase [Halopseudomonas phragmitis]RHW22579.1 glycerophosphodiester phosphodiesterase [Pseudomonas jilinensis]